MKISIILCILLFSCLFTFAYRNDSLDLAFKKIDSLRFELDKQKDNAKHLETSYSTGLSIINYYITVALAIITILGFLGIKSLSSTRRKYAKELEKFRRYQRIVRSSYKRLIEEVNEKVNSEINDINKKLDFNLAIAEIKAHVHYQNFVDAYTSTLAALERFSGNEELLERKALLAAKLYNYKEAIEILEGFKESYKNYVSLQWNLLELYLLNNQTNKFKPLFDKHEKEIKKRRPATTAYLKAYFFYLTGDTDELKRLIRGYLDVPSIFGSESLEDHFKEFYNEINKQNFKDKKLILDFVDFLKGNKSIDQIKNFQQQVD